MTDLSRITEALPDPSRTMTAVLLGDVRETLKQIPDESIQCVVTSPPYYGLRNYNVDGQIGLEPTPDDYVAEMVAVFREVRRVLREDGSCWLNLGDSYARGFGGGSPGTKSATNVGSFQERKTGKVPDGFKSKDLLGIPWMVAFALRADGWYLRSAIIWHKPNPMTESVKDRPTSAYENVFLLTKNDRYFYDADAIAEPSSYQIPSDRKVSNAYSEQSGGEDGGKHRSGGFVTGSTRNARNVWTITPKPFKGAHFATMPIDLADRCIKAATSEAGRCPTCSAPWKRIVEKGEPDLAHMAACGADASGGYEGQAVKDYAAGGAQNASDVKRRILEGMRRKTTVGWEPTCTCPPHIPVPCIVLDPFGGSGTTAMAANALGQDAVLCELNPAYIDIAKKRLGKDVYDFFIWSLL